MKTATSNRRTAGAYYDAFLSFDLLDIIQIAQVVHGEKPKIYVRDDFWLDETHRSKAHTQLKTAALAGKLKTAKKIGIEFHASPKECCTYLQSKGFHFPKALAERIPDNKRSKESYLPQEVRGDEKAIKAVLRTLLDSYPDYPKNKLIKLKPVRVYANGEAHGDEYLSKIITEIEGSKRQVGAPNKNKMAAIQKEIPPHWL